MLRAALGRSGVALPGPPPKAGGGFTGGGLVPLDAWLRASADPTATVAVLGGGGDKFIEIELPASVTAALGSTLVARVVDLPASSPEGVLFELEIVGCSNPGDLQCLGPLFLGTRLEP